MRRFIHAALATMLIAAMGAIPAFAQDAQAIITSPTSGQRVSGLVPIIGTVTAGDFSRYDLSFGPDPGDGWQVFASANVLLTNAQIGTWDATGLNGTFAIRLQVFRSDGSVVAETIVRGLIAGEPSSPTPEASPTNVPPPPTFGVESAATIQPTVVIEQPPTATPTPATGVAETGASSQRDQGGIDLSRFTTACINGVWCAVGAYLLLGAYVFGRWGVRKILKQIGRTTKDEGRM